MAFSFLDNCGFLATSTGTVDLVVASVLSGGYQTPAGAAAVTGARYRYRAYSNDQSQWEIGYGTYTVGSLTLTRTTVLFNSLGTTAKVSFTAAPNVVMGLLLAEDVPAGAYGGLRNIIINGGFTVNQRGYVSAATMAAGVYGHDRWKAGTAGGDYTYTQLNSNTQISITATKSLIQIIENINVVGGNYIISWTGTATARVGVNTTTPSGNFAVSPIVLAGQTAGTTCSIEFTGANAAGGSSLATVLGTLGTVQCELGYVDTPFENRPYPTELQLCMRYYQQYPAAYYAAYGYNSVGSTPYFFIPTGNMRAAPTVNVGTWTSYSNCSGATAFGATPQSFSIYVTVTGTGAFAATSGIMTASAEL
jgi:hypothetical protein